MDIVVCLTTGYLLGSMSPAALLAKRKHVNLRKLGSGNLGATNTMLVLGKGYGALVMVIDVLKSILAAKICRWLFPKLALAGLIAGLAAIIGHVFPFYMGFRGGKGLAAFAGMILAYSPRIFLMVLFAALTMMFIANYSYAAPMTAAALFPVLAWLHSGDPWVLLITAAASALIVVKHWSNIGKALRGQDVKIREFFKNGMEAEDI